MLKCCHQLHRDPYRVRPIGSLAIEDVGDSIQEPNDTERDDDRDRNREELEMGDGGLRTVGGRILHRLAGPLSHPPRMPGAPCVRHPPSGARGPAATSPNRARTVGAEPRGVLASRPRPSPARRPDTRRVRTRAGRPPRPSSPSRTTASAIARHAAPEPASKRSAVSSGQITPTSWVSISPGSSSPARNPRTRSDPASRSTS